MALFTVVSLAGLIVISLWVGHISLAVGIKTVITKKRVIAALITLDAVIFSTWDRFIISDFSIVLDHFSGVSW